MSSRSLRVFGLYVLLPLAVASFVVGLSVYISMNSHVDTAMGKLPDRVSAAQELRSIQHFACPVALKDEASRQERSELEHRAEELMQAQSYEQALATYRELGGMDPAYPGVNLDISMALSKLKRPEAAKQAIDAQLALSMCMAQLFPNELEPYCKAEKFGSTADCMKELASIQQGAYIQAALVQMDLDPAGANGPLRKGAEEGQQGATGTHPLAPPETAALQQARPAAAPAAKVLPAASLPGARPAPHAVVARKDELPAGPKRLAPPGGSSLATGVGTDSALGAYTK